uniref:Eukaryotic translation initiation factor 2-alpha kinase 2 n=1 Tax=Monopterus albus TaxID=43700 RepID=A0A3Q3IT91_MONAL
MAIAYTKLNEYAQKTRLEVRYEDVGSAGPDHIKTFTLRAVLNGKVYPDGVGKNKKEAKQNAAKNALRGLLEDIDQFRSYTENATEASTSPVHQTSVSNINYICWLNEYGQKNRVTVRPVESTRLGPDNAVLGCSFVVGDKEYPAAFGKTRKEAKEEAAKLVYHEICGSKTPEVSSNTHLVKKPAKFTSEFDSIECLGKGAFGRVYKARQKLLQKYYAIKIVRWKEKSLREVAALSDLQHCNIIRYFTCWMEDGGYQWDSAPDSSSTSQSSSDSVVKYLYIQMELCDTKTLRVWIDEKNTQNVKKSLRNSKRREKSLDIAQQIVSGVEYIHSKMLIHRDLKPANIMFGRDGEVKIGDFGLVTAENNDDAENLLERTVYKGTPSYMAPEQSKSIYDRKVDIFALGLIYFELLWNLPAGSDRKVIGALQSVTAFFLNIITFSNFVVSLQNQIIKSMLHVKPEDRPEASKVKRELDECANALQMLKNKDRESRTV